MEVYDRRWKKWRKVAESKPGVSARIPNYTKKGLEIIGLTSDSLWRFFIGKYIEPFTWKKYVPDAKDVSESQLIDHENPKIFEVPVGEPVRVLIRFKKRGNLQKVRITRISSESD